MQVRAVKDYIKAPEAVAAQQQLFIFIFIYLFINLKVRAVKDYIKAPEAVAAQLVPEEVVALRLWTVYTYKLFLNIYILFLKRWLR
jgi:hypothetical protein